MKVLAIDIGAGTQDILLYDSQKRLENCIKLVLPSPSPLFAAEVATATAQAKDIFMEGCVIGGGAFSKAVKAHLSKGFQAYMLPTTAYCLRNNLEDVRSSGVKIVESKPEDFSGISMWLDELDLRPLEALLESVGESLEELSAAGVAVQDHGIYSRGESNRKTRLHHFQKKLSEDPHLSSLAFREGMVSERFPRMQSAMRRLREQLSCKHLLVMDTAPAAISGCLSDNKVSSLADGNLLIINAGNGHTLACLLCQGRVVAFLEHHTKYLEASSFARYLELFCSGKAKDEDQFMEKGHGLFYLEQPPGWGHVDLIAVTGPHRELLEQSGLDIYYPSPGGDMMMTGPMGIVQTLKSLVSGL